MVVTGRGVVVICSVVVGDCVVSGSVCVNVTSKVVGSRLVSVVNDVVDAELVNLISKSIYTTLIVFAILFLKHKIIT